MSLPLRIYLVALTGLVATLALGMLGHHPAAFTAGGPFLIIAGAAMAWEAWTSTDE